MPTRVTGYTEIASSVSLELLQQYRDAQAAAIDSEINPAINWTVMPSGGLAYARNDVGYIPGRRPDPKAVERADLKQLIATGQSDLKMYSDGVRLVVKGFNFDNVRTLFILDGTKLLAPKKRTTHLKALLVKLAQREGVELEFTSQLPSLRLRRIVYWPFKLEVDDSALLTAQPAITEKPEEADSEGDTPYGLPSQQRLREGVPF